MALYDPRPLSIYERRVLVTKLRNEAAEKTAEADRIEAGIKSDEDAMVTLIKESIAKTQGYEDEL
jgi:hypothetical protein